MLAWRTWPLLLATGCSEADRYIDTIDEPRAHAVILAELGSSAPLLTAYPYGEGAPPIRVAVDRASTLHAFLYADTLEELGLQPGSIPTFTEEADHRLVPQDRLGIFETHPADDEPKWTALEESPADSLYIARIPPRCTNFELELIEGSPDPLNPMVLPFPLITQGRVLIGNHNGQLYELVGNRLQLVRLVPPARKGWASKDGRYWLASGTQMASYTLDGSRFSDPGFLFGASSTVSVVAGGRDDGVTPYVYVGLEDGQVIQIHGEEMRTLMDLDTIPVEIQELGDDGLVVFDHTRAVYVLEDGTTNRVRLDTGVNVESILVTPELGLVIGTNDGDLIHRAGNGWMSLLERSYGFTVNDVIAYDGGFLSALSSGFVIQLQQGIDPCELFQTTLLAFRTELVPLGRDVIGLTRDERNGFLAFRLSPAQ